MLIRLQNKKTTESMSFQVIVFELISNVIY